MQEVWQAIEDFPGYFVSTHGRVKKEPDGDILALKRNQTDCVFVSLNRDGRQHQRALSKLVGDAFLQHNAEIHNTPMHKDLDRSNNRLDNLVWRPRWYVHRYNILMTKQWFWFTNRPIRELATGLCFDNPQDAAFHFGLLVTHINKGLDSGEPVWPNNQVFVDDPT
jgi:hypothetical protein